MTDSAMGIEAAKPLPRPGRGTAWLVLFAVVYLVATVVFFAGAGVYVAITNPGMSPDEVQTFFSSSHIMAFIPGMYVTQFICLLPLILLASRFPGQSVRETLALKPVSTRQLTFWVGVYGLYQAAAITLHTLVDIPVDDFVQDMAGQPHVLMALTLVLLAPVLEEVVFRGYLFKAWRHSWLGVSGTIVVTSALFVSLHLGQYGWAILGQLFVFAIILGLAREKTGSLVTPWLLHLLNNLMAVILIMYLGWV